MPRRQGQGVYGNTFEHGEAIEEGDEEIESEFSYFEESFEEMRRRRDIEILAKFPPGQRAQFWVERRESFRDLPLPPAPTHKMPVKGEKEEEGEKGREDLELQIGRVKGEEAWKGRDGQESRDSPPLVPAPVPEVSRRERLAYLRRTLPPENRALLNRALKEQKKLRQQFKGKLTLVTVSGKKKIPLPRPRDEPPLPFF